MKHLLKMYLSRHQSCLNDNIYGQLVSIQDSLSKLTDAITKVPIWPSVIESGKTFKRRRIGCAAECSDSGVINFLILKIPKSNSEVVGSAEEKQPLFFDYEIK